MKKAILRAGMATFLLLSFLSGSVLADLPGSGWWVYYRMMNVSGDEGQLVMEAYRTGDATTYTGSATIGAWRTLGYHPGLSPTYPSGDLVGFSPELPSGFQGAVVLLSSVPLAAVGEVANYASGSVGVAGGTAGGFYQAFSDDMVDTTISFPLVKHNFADQTTTFYVQAAGEDADVTITYRMSDGSVHTQNTLIAANHMFAFDPANATPPVASTGCLPAETSPCLGAATVESASGPIAAVVVEYPHTGSPAHFALSTRGFTTGDEGTTLYAPTIKNQFYGGTTGWSVQNVGDSATTVNVAFTVSNFESGVSGVSIGDVFYDSELVEPGEATVFSRWRDNLGGMPAGVVASGVAEADQPLVGSVSDWNTSFNNIPGGDAKAVYSCFVAEFATGTVALPYVKEGLSGKTTQLQVVNAGDLPTRFIATYTDSNGVVRTFQTVRDDIQPGEAMPFFEVYKNLGGRFEGLSDFSVLKGTLNSVVITTSNGEPVIALAQESDRANQRLDIKNYEGFNLLLP